MSEIERKSCYFIVFDWMLTELKLSGYQAFIYAAIHNYSQDPKGCFSGSISYLQDTLGASRQAVINALAELVKKGLIVKKETFINGVKFNTYRSTDRNCTGSLETRPPVQKSCEGSLETRPGGSLETRPNNKDIYKKDNKDNPPLSPLDSKTPKRKTRLPDNWFLPKEWGDWALLERQDLTVEDIRLEANQFRDYWLSKGETHADWYATWRTWVRRIKRTVSAGMQKKTIYEQNREAGKRAKEMLFGVSHD